MSIKEEYIQQTYSSHVVKIQQHHCEQLWQNYTSLFADGDTFNQFALLWSHHEAAAEPGSLTARPASQQLPWANVMQAPGGTHTDILTSYHYLSVESRSSCAPPLAPDSCFSHPLLSPSCLNCCSPCPLHRASSHTSCSCSSSNPPSQATFAKSWMILLIELHIYLLYICVYTRVTLKPCLSSDEGPLWPYYYNLCSTPSAITLFH